METWDAIRSRRNVRRFAARTIPDGDLDRILEAGRRTPSSRNEQRWDFVVSTDREQLQQLARVWRSAGHVAESAATVAIVAPIPNNDYQRKSIQYDLGQATMSMMLAAADLGIGSAHAAVSDQDRARSILALPPGRSCEWLIAFGYPSDHPLRVIRRPARRPLNDVVHRNRW
jgi:nitroreductase